jgi:hypothetical protein
VQFDSSPSNSVKKILIFSIICLVALPAAAVATVLLTPLWRWLEAATGIESIGHSGPSEWCFIAVYLLILVISFSAWRLSQTK